MEARSSIRHEITPIPVSSYPSLHEVTCFVVFRGLLLVLVVARRLHWPLFDRPVRTLPVNVETIRTTKERPPL